MKTEIRTFCQELAERLGPFAAEVDQALQTLPEGESDPLLASWRLRLREARHRAETLGDKIAQQHAYLLIFGPLKSGKSTLMNAVSAAYISEVSSLPAYPALVYARHGDERSFQATSYAGDKIDFADAKEMAAAVGKGHEALAAKILEVERAGESFEPHRHFSEAIRRMDVQTPAPALADSGSVLVDTPGLYARMRFGYDVMTKDFRDNASCAIFVVKSDNLFFEKVFEEFHALLGHFSRIFLVVNIDSSKRDLNPDGSLTPSLESSNPEAILEAFQAFAMSAPLREAYDRGNLHVYAIDLLKAASRRLKEAAGVPPEEAAVAEVARGDGFDAFVDDLTAYLNSSDYLREFMRDSLNVGASLQAEVSSVVSDGVSGRLSDEREQWAQRLEEAKSKMEALDVLDRIDFYGAFGEARKEKDRLLEENAGKDRGALSAALSAGLDKWMDSDDTLRALRDDYLNQQIAREANSDAEVILGRLREMMATEEGGPRFSMPELRALEQAGLQLDAIAPDLEGVLGADGGLTPPRLELKAEDVPVKRSFLDCVMFRKPKAVREKFFGPEGTEFVASAKKKKRIVGPQLEALREKIMSYPQSELPQSQRDYINAIFDAYTVEFGQVLRGQRASLEVQFREERDRCEAALKSNLEMQAVVDRLAGANESFGAAIVELRDAFGTELGENALYDEPRFSEALPEDDDEDQARLALDPEQLDAVRERLSQIPSEEEVERR